MWVTNIKDYSMYNSAEIKNIRKEMMQRKKDRIEFINNEYNDEDILKRNDKEKVLIYRNFHDENNIFKGEIEFNNEIAVEWANYICYNDGRKKQYLEMVNKKPYTNPFIVLMEYRNELVDNFSFFLPNKFYNVPETDEEFRKLHIYLQDIFQEPFSYDNMSYIKRMLAEGYTMIELYSCKKLYPRMTFLKLMDKMTDIINKNK